MGCCFSTSRGDESSPYNSANNSNTVQDSRIPNVTDSISRNSQAVTQATTSPSGDARHTARHRSHFFGSNRGDANPQSSRSNPFKPPPEPKNIEAPMVSAPDGEPKPASTLRMLKKARTEYFETRVTGRAEMWSVVETVCGLVENGSYKDAHAILEAAGGTCPTGVLWGSKGGCFDDRGERYTVPSWCVGKPDSVHDGVHDGADDSPSLRNAIHDSKVERMSDDASGSFNRDTKGKGKVIDEQGAIKGKEISVKVRFSHTARDDVFTVGDEDALETLAQKARHKAAIPFDIKVRFVHLGHLMDHNLTLAEQTWEEGQVLSLYVFE